MHKNNKNPWYHCALYEVWRDMMKTARIMFNRGFRDTDDGFPVDPIFRDYLSFVLWVRVFYKYKIGETDDYMIGRHDLHKGFTTDNCFCFCCRNCGYRSNDDRIGAMNLFNLGLNWIKEQIENIEGISLDVGVQSITPRCNDSQSLVGKKRSRTSKVRPRATGQLQAHPL